jgi:predicted  nucleic acid-binding Zn-ribbon protein
MIQPKTLKNLLKEIKYLRNEKKRNEKKFDRLIRLLDKKKPKVINSSNWENWQRLSIEHDEMKRIMNDIDKKLSQVENLYKKMR